MSSPSKSNSDRGLCWGHTYRSGHETGGTHNVERGDTEYTAGVKDTKLLQH